MLLSTATRSTIRHAGGSLVLLGGVVVQVEAEPAGEFLKADRDAGLADAHALKQGGLLGVGGRRLPLAPKQAAHPRGRLLDRLRHHPSPLRARIPPRHGGPRRWS